MRSTHLRLDVTASDGRIVSFATPVVPGMAERIRIVLEFNNGRGRLTKHVIDLPVEFLDPDDIRVQFTDPPPDARQMRAVGERLVRLAEELRGDG